MHITLKQLKAFQAVASLGQVRLAAEQLSLSQPATSMAIAELEHQLGCQLFDRTGNKLLINSQGELLMPLASEQLDRLQEIEDLFRGLNGSHGGHLKIGASTTIGNYLLPATLAELTQKHEKMRLSLDINNTRSIISKIARFDLDIGCVEGPCLHEALNIIPWQEDELVIVCAPDHPFAQRSTVTLDDLDKEEWILREPGSGTRNLFNQNIGQQLRSLRIKMELNQTEAIKNMIQSGQGISCLSNLCIQNEVLQGKLTTVEVSGLSLKRQLSILIHKNKYYSHGMKLLLSAMGARDKSAP